MKNRKFLILLSLFVLSACAKKVDLLNKSFEILEEPPPMHIAYLYLGDATTPIFDFQSCFYSEPGIEWYTTAQTYRILREREVNVKNIGKIRSLPPLVALSDFDLLLVAKPHEDRLLLRSFRFKQHEVVESIVDPSRFNCELLYRSFHMIKIFSVPDQAYLFVDRKFRGRTPKWVMVPKGNHLFRIELDNAFIGQKELNVPDLVTYAFKGEGAKTVTPTGSDDLTTSEKAGMATATILGVAIGIAAAIIPILLLL